MTNSVKRRFPNSKMAEGTEWSYKLTLSITGKVNSIQQLKYGPDWVICCTMFGNRGANLEQNF